MNTWPFAVIEIESKFLCWENGDLKAATNAARVSKITRE
jgi:hypothetical protein